MTDIIDRAEAALKDAGTYWQATAFEARCLTLMPELVDALRAERVMRDETQRQLSQFIADFCALRDALPREQVERILSKEPAK